MKEGEMARSHENPIVEDLDLFETYGDDPEAAKRVSFIKNHLRNLMEA